MSCVSDLLVLEGLCQVRMFQVQYKLGYDGEIRGVGYKRVLENRVL